MAEIPLKDTGVRMSSTDQLLIAAGVASHLRVSSIKPESHMAVSTSIFWHCQLSALLPDASLLQLL